MRPLGRSYLQHGRRHAPQGSDPIPQLGGVPMIVANGGAAAVTGSTDIDLTAYLTTEPEVYSLALGTGGRAAIHGISIAQEGVYRAWFQYRFSGATDGDTLAGSYDGGAGPNMLWLISNTQSNDETEVIFDSTALPAQVTTVQFARLFLIGGTLEPGPMAALPRFVFAQTDNQTGGGGSAYTVAVEVLVERLGTSYTTNSVAPF